MLSTLSHVRRLGVAALATTAALVVVAITLPVLADATAGVRDGTWASAPFEDLLVWLCASSALVAGTCWWLGTLRLVAAARPGVPDAGVPTPAGLPTWLRRLVLAACGVVLVAAPVSPALATGDGSDPVTPLVLPTATGDRPAEGPGGLPLPDRVAGEPTPERALRARPSPAPTTRAETHAVRVATGDSLWQIATAQLTAETGARPRDPAVAVRWQLIYAANQDRIGPDPDLILPGQHLDLDHP